MQSIRRPAFNFCRPLPTVPACGPCPSAALQQTISNIPHFSLRLLHCPLLLLALALALLLSACPGAHACRAGSSSRNPYAYVRAGSVAGSPPPPPVHKMPPLAFGTVVCTPFYYVTSTVQSFRTLTLCFVSIYSYITSYNSWSFAANTSTCKELTAFAKSAERAKIGVYYWFALISWSFTVALLRVRVEN